MTKEEQGTQQQPRSKNAVIMPVSKDSLHRQYLTDDADFDLHLMVYDDSYPQFRLDTPFVTRGHGYKMDMAYRYLNDRPELIDAYEYFFLVDDDIRMTAEAVNSLFAVMRQYRLRIAQPSLSMSYATYAVTLHDPTCLLRYTDFVEMMMPCFSREALLKVMPTFKERARWCGIEFHWPVLIGTDHEDMAIIDSLKAVHTRPLQTKSYDNLKVMDDYMRRNGLVMNENVYSRISIPADSLHSMGYAVTDSKGVAATRGRMAELVSAYFTARHPAALSEALYLGAALFVAAFVTERREYFAASEWWFDKLHEAAVAKGTQLSVRMVSALRSLQSALRGDGLLAEYAEGLPGLLNETLASPAIMADKGLDCLTENSPSRLFLRSAIEIGEAYNRKISQLTTIIQ